MNTTELVVEIRPEKKTISSLVFITARIAYIRFLTAVHIDDFHMFTVSISKHSEACNVTVVVEIHHNYIA